MLPEIFKTGIAPHRDTYVYPNIENLAHRYQH